MVVMVYSIHDGNANNSTVSLFKIRKIADEDLGRCLDKIWIMSQENRYYRNNSEGCVNRMNDRNKKDGNGHGNPIVGATASASVLKFPSNDVKSLLLSNKIIWLCGASGHIRRISESFTITS